MIVRTLLGLLATCAVAALIWCALERTPAAVATASALQGERWYTLRLDGQGVGYYRSTADRGRGGRWQFRTELRFALADGEPVTVIESYAFDSAEPYALTAASHQVTRPGSHEAVTLSRQAGALVAVREMAGEKLAPQPVSWRYALPDYLAFESWLRDARPAAGDSFALKSPRLETLELATEQLVLDSFEDGRYRVRKRALPGDTLIELDEQLVPVLLELGGVFKLARTDKDTALAARTPLKKASYRLPLSAPLQRHEQLARLALRATGNDAHEFPEPFVLIANPLLPASSNSYLGASLSLPVAHPRLLEIVERLALAALPPGEQLERLVHYVHGALRYDEAVSFRSVLTLLDDPRGDCTEFADLLTTLARTAGLPARTVIGMAYDDEPSPSLAFHAWNQVQVNGRWQAVDPTWNQLTVDATHWPLPASERKALLLLTGQLDVELEVLDLSYQRKGTLASAAQHPPRLSRAGFAAGPPG
jgi:hypothetical protein